MNLVTPNNIEKVAQALYEHDLAHMRSRYRRPSWLALEVRKQIEYRGRAEAALVATPQITGTN